MPAWDPDFQTDYLDTLSSRVARAEILARRAVTELRLDDPAVRGGREMALDPRWRQVEQRDLGAAAVRLGGSDEFVGAERERLVECLKEFSPWKKGPFQIGPIYIDSEWRSDWKWQRIVGALGDLRGSRVADIGCHNGYFMFRLAQHEPELVVGFEPVARHRWCFHFLQRLAQVPQIYFELLGVEDIHLYAATFDVILCLGILYHHTDPVGLLRKMETALAPGGKIIIDCQGIPGKEPVAMVPARRYAGARGIWFLPTASCLETWVRRAGFSKLESLYAAPLSSDEQRSTPWADIRSLSDFLDPTDAQRTIEGYPAPWRYYLCVQR